MSHEVQIQACIDRIELLSMQTEMVLTDIIERVGHNKVDAFSLKMGMDFINTLAPTPYTLRMVKKMLEQTAGDPMRDPVGVLSQAEMTLNSLEKALAFTSAQVAIL